MVLNQDFREFIQLLNKNKVRYLVIGGYAVAFHGHPRYTKDIDFWIGPYEANTKKLIKALYEFGFGSLDLRAREKITSHFIHPGFRPSLSDPQPQNPRNSLLFLWFCGLGSNKPGLNPCA